MKSFSSRDFNMDELPNATSNASTERTLGENTSTFLIGFGVLLTFVVVGIFGSIFLCMTLKKDRLLWRAEVETQIKTDTHLETEVEKLSVE